MYNNAYELFESAALTAVIIVQCTSPMQEAKDHNVALKSELDLLKLDLEAGCHGSKGNSLFGEVEDKRVEAERKFISLQVRHESLEKNHSVTKQRYARLKVRVRTFVGHIVT